MNGKTVDGLEGQTATGQRDLNFFPRQAVQYQVHMCRLASTKRWRSAGTLASALLMLALLIFLDAAAASSPLHRAVCPDAGKPTDTCAVATFAGGTVADSPAPAVLAIAVCLVLVIARWTDEVLASAPVFRLSPSRAPPRRGMLPG
jgi:hypothetical protein